MTSTGGGLPGDLQPGNMVGEYRVDQQIGEGGMGKVYSATHPVIAKRAAIKILHPELSMNREAVERFVQEARSVNQIGHPNIVDIFSFGTLADGPLVAHGHRDRESVRAGVPGNAAEHDMIQILDPAGADLDYFKIPTLRHLSVSP